MIHVMYMLFLIGLQMVWRHRATDCSPLQLAFCARLKLIHVNHDKNGGVSYARSNKFCYIYISVVMKLLYLMYTHVASMLPNAILPLQTRTPQIEICMIYTFVV